MFSKVDWKGKHNFLADKIHEGTLKACSPTIFTTGWKIYQGWNIRWEIPLKTIFARELGLTDKFSLLAYGVSVCVLARPRENYSCKFG